ncbi:MAG: response regulator transcription factor [Spirochaetes bacterium]|nr:response regulator transcription factor [Spirochaetota bacterium]MBU1081926.1 response regulator transcription factor [Spirochaetota bacterium]
MNTIAVVDDERNIRAAVRIALEREGYRVEEYSNGDEAWASFRGGFPDLVVLDVMMPRMDGIELCRRVRALGERVPIVFLSSRDDEIDRVLGLESGGDDYVCKPFGMRELLARVRAALRRGSPASDDGSPRAPGIVAGPLSLDDERFLASLDGRRVPLTVTEYRMLRSLAENPGAVKTREQLMRAAFPDDAYPNDRAADSHIKRIRAKLSAAGAAFGGIDTVYGLGYRLGAEP